MARALPAERRRVSLARWAAIAAGGVTALALAEASIGVVAPSYDPRGQIHFADIGGVIPIVEPNSVTRQVKNTGDYDVTVRANRYGFRDSKDTATAGPGDYVLVGDSYGFGWGVEESDRMSDLLAKQLGARVFNIAVTGNFDTYQLLLDYAAREGAKIRKVIVCAAMESDIQLYGVPPPAPAAAPAQQRFFELKSRLMRNSGLYFIATAAVHRVPALERMAIAAGLITPNLEGVPDEKFDPRIVESSAERLSTLAKRYETTVVLVPSRALWHGTHTDDARRTHDAFAARLRALGVDIVDLRPAFEEGGTPLQYHFHNDPHWNKAGNALAAKIVAAHLMQAR
jgi:hypothetical protein